LHHVRSVRGAESSLVFLAFGAVDRSCTMYVSLDKFTDRIGYSYNGRINA
jgi:hypothetical protein